MTFNDIYLINIREWSRISNAKTIHLIDGTILEDKYELIFIADTLPPHIEYLGKDISFTSVTKAIYDNGIEVNFNKNEVKSIIINKT